MMIILAALLACFPLPAARTYQAAPAANSTAFFHEIVGDWVGTFDQSTDKVKTPTKYLHAVARQTAPDSFETVFRYYKIDPQSRKPVDAGVSTMATKIAPGGTVTNTITGTGDVLIDPKTLKSVQHQLIETAKLSSPDALQGSGTGAITVTDVRGPGRYGKVLSYSSTWSIANGELRIIQQFKVRFRVLFFGRTYSVSMAHTLKRGNDVMSLVSNSH